MRNCPASAPCFDHYHQLIEKEIGLTDRPMAEQAHLMVRPEVPDGQVLWINQPTPSGNEWLIRMQKRGDYLHFTSFYRYKNWDGDTLALVPSRSNFILHITAHAIKRMRKRLNLGDLPVFSLYESLSRRLTSPGQHIRPNRQNRIAVVLDGGFGLGNYYPNYGALAIKTFVEFSRLSPRQFKSFRKLIKWIPATDFNRKLFYHEWSRLYPEECKMVA